jgi:hypothetical protein
MSSANGIVALLDMHQKMFKYHEWVKTLVRRPDVRLSAVVELGNVTEEILAQLLVMVSLYLNAVGIAGNVHMTDVRDENSDNDSSIDTDDDVSDSVSDDEFESIYGSDDDDESDEESDDESEQSDEYEYEYEESEREDASEFVRGDDDSESEVDSHELEYENDEAEQNFTDIVIPPRGPSGLYDHNYDRVVVKYGPANILSVRNEDFRPQPTFDPRDRDTYILRDRWDVSAVTYGNLTRVRSVFLEPVNPENRPRVLDVYEDAPLWTLSMQVYLPFYPPMVVSEVADKLLTDDSTLETLTRDTESKLRELINHNFNLHNPQGLIALSVKYPNFGDYYTKVIKAIGPESSAPVLGTLLDHAESINWGVVTVIAEKMPTDLPNTTVDEYKKFRATVYNEWGINQLALPEVCVIDMFVGERAHRTEKEWRLASTIIEEMDLRG